MRRPVFKSLPFLRLIAGIFALSLVHQTLAICENVTHVNDVTFSIIGPRDSSLWVGTASRGLLRIGATGRPFAYSTLTGHLKCDSIVALAFDENGLLWIRDGRDSVLTYSTLDGFVPRSEVPDSIREQLVVMTAPEVEEPVVYEAKKPAVWPWILVIACLVAVICFLLVYYSRKRGAAPASSPVASPEPEVKPAKAVEIAPKETKVEPKDTPEAAIKDEPKVAPKEAIKEAPKEVSNETPAKTELLIFEELGFEAKVKDIVEKNYTDKDFSVDQIAAELGISRVHLSRKLKALSAASPSDMIKARRMTAAADMLRSGESNMAIVAASCGFASPAYFSAAFKAFYGVSPSAFK